MSGVIQTGSHGAWKGNEIVNQMGEQVADISSGVLPFTMRATSGPELRGIFEFCGACQPVTCGAADDLSGLRLESRFNHGLQLLARFHLATVFWLMPC